MIKKSYNYIVLTLEVVKHNIMSAMEYRIAFFTLVAGMILNDIGWLIMWSIFFARFPSINGWNLHDTLILFSFNMTNFGLYKIFAGHAEEISHDIIQGNLDYFMTLPKSVLWQVSTAETSISAIGDCIFGVGLFLCLGFSWTHFLLYILLCAVTSMILYNFVVILQSLGFFLGNFEETGDRIYTLLLGLTFYPATTFSGILKFITFTFLPVFFIVWAPVDMIKLFQWHVLGLIVGFWLLTLSFAVWIFNRGLRRYESGNLINVKM